MIEQTITQLRQLKLSGMANALVSQIEQPNTYEGLPFEERLQLLADSEYQDRENRKQRGESLFLRKLVLGIPAQASGKNLTRLLCLRRPDSSSSPRPDPTGGRNIGSK